MLYITGPPGTTQYLMFEAGTGSLPRGHEELVRNTAKNYEWNEIDFISTEHI